MKIYIFLLSIFLSAYSYAGYSGFSYRGKNYIVYKDGEKIGKDFSELFPNEGSKQNRKITSVEQTDSHLKWEEHEGNYCYHWQGRETAYNATPIFCVKK